MRPPNILAIGASEAAKAKGESRYRKVKRAIKTLDQRGAKAEKDISVLADGQRRLTRTLAMSGREIRLEISEQIKPLAAFIHDQQLEQAIETRRKEAAERQDYVDDEWCEDIGACITAAYDAEKTKLNEIYATRLTEIEATYNAGIKSRSANPPKKYDDYNKIGQQLFDDRERANREAHDALCAALDAAEERFEQRWEEAGEALNKIKDAFDEWFVVINSTQNVVMALRGAEYDDETESKVRGNLESIRASLAGENDPIAIALQTAMAKAPHGITNDELQTVWDAFDAARDAAYGRVKAQYEIDFG